MNVTLGVPRIKEIFNSTEKIATPIIEIILKKGISMNEAKLIKNKVNSIYLGDVVDEIVEVYEKHSNYLILKIDLLTIANNMPYVF